jgi:hypothetical protein
MNLAFVCGTWRVQMLNVGGAGDAVVLRLVQHTTPVAPVLLSGAKAGVSGFNLPAGMNKGIITKGRAS